MSRVVMRSVIGVSVLLSIGCGQQPTEQSSLRTVTELNGLRLELSLDRTTIPAGDSARATMRLRNETAIAVRVEFGSTCQISPYIERAAGGIEYPGGGEWMCGAAITFLDVPANDAVTRTLVLRGAARTEEGNLSVALPPGGYRIYALGPAARGVVLRSPTVAFEVR